MPEILLYYKYTPIADPAAFCAEQRALCTKLNLKGRIIVAAEGINGTVEGDKENTQKYVDAMLSDPRFKDMNFKRSSGTGNAFPKLSVKVRSELVSGHLGADDVDPNVTTGKYVEAEELHTWIHGDANGNGKREIYIVDMRNDYEHKIGYFSAQGGSALGGQNSVLLPMKNFRDLPLMLPKLEHLKNKTVVTVCTGGVRCEKASGFLVKNGFADVYQLHNGIVTYMEKYPEEDFKGKLYVFDGRVAMGFNSPTIAHEIVGRCSKCGTPSENYVNCQYLTCHAHFICCEKCLDKQGKAYCSWYCSLRQWLHHLSKGFSFGK